MAPHTTDWTLTNSQGLDIIGTTDHPDTDPTACLVLLHGFKGYKDYGFIPVLASALSSAGILVHRINFSTSGMTNDVETFARPDLFALDTWNRQVEDVRCTFGAIQSGEIEGHGLPLFLAGHSRGGGTALLTAGRTPQPKLSGLITINSVDACNRLTKEAQLDLIDAGSSITESARTGQILKIHSAWLQEQLDAPDAHDVLSLCTTLKCPTLILHGSDDQAVDIEAGHNISKALRNNLHIIARANHVLNTANPAPKGVNHSPQLREVIELIGSFVNANQGK